MTLTLRWEGWKRKGCWSLREGRRWSGWRGGRQTKRRRSCWWAKRKRDWIRPPCQPYHQEHKPGAWERMVTISLQREWKVLTGSRQLPTNRDRMGGASAGACCCYLLHPGWVPVCRHNHCRINCQIHQQAWIWYRVQSKPKLCIFKMPRMFGRVSSVQARNITKEPKNSQGVGVQNEFTAFIERESWKDWSAERRHREQRTWR